MEGAMKKNTGFVFLLVVFCVSMTTQICIASRDTISVTVRANPYLIVHEEGMDCISMEGFHYLNVPGKPKLPSKTFLMALPPGADVVSVNVQGLEENTLPGTYNIMAAERIRPLFEPHKNPGHYADLEREWNENYQAAYTAQRPYPAERGSLVMQGTLRKYVYAAVSFHPFSYEPETGRLTRFDKARISIVCDVPDPDSRAYHDLKIQNQDTLADDRASELFINFHDVRDRYARDPSLTVGYPQQWDLVILTTETIEETIVSTQFPDWKRSTGHSVKLVRVSDPEITGQPGRDLAEQIRNFLRSTYISWGIEYVLIIGDCETVPMRYCFPDPSNHSNDAGNPNPLDSGEVPTDYYYADLSHEDNAGWDSDQDGFHGEYGEDNPDFIPEISVGRIPVSHTGRIAYTLNKLMAYEQDTGEWKRHALHAGAILFYEDENHSGYPEIDGARYPHEIEHNLLGGWEIRHFCEKEGLAPSSYDWEALTEPAFTEAWRTGQYSIVNWAGHGWSNAVGRVVWVWDDGDGVPEYSEMESPSLITTGSSVEEDYPSIVTAISCLVGYPEPNSSGRLGVDLLTKFSSGSAAGIVSATRPAAVSGAWPEECLGAESLLYEFNHQMIEGSSGPENLGPALYLAKSYCHLNGGWDHWYEYLNLFNFNLYGDPSMVQQGTVPVTPTPTPACDNVSVEVWMPSEYYLPGDTFECKAFLCNPEVETYHDRPVFVVLDAFGELFFAPSFTGFDHYTLDLPYGRFPLTVLSEFPWPQGAGSADGLRWMAVVTNSKMTEILGDYDVFTFGFGE
jgi:Peptidase family C25